MLSKNFTFITKDSLKMNMYKWEPKDKDSVKGIINIAHGMAESGIRYERFAKTLVDNGFIVYAGEHRGHGLTCSNIEDLGYICDNDGFHTMVEDLKEINNFIKEENLNLPIIIMGHSMGSFLAQRYIEEYGDTVNGAIISGTNGNPGLILNFGIFISSIEMRIRGRKAKSKLLDGMIFGTYNKRIHKNKTRVDWLTRDEEEVEKFINDPYCGTVFTTSFFNDLMKGLKVIHKEENLNKIPKNLPILIFSGDADPVGRYGKGLDNLINLYKSLGIKNLHYKIYKDGRHEMLNEINKDEVFEDIINWLNLVIL
ncbi:MULTISPECIES: alpha/beta hydrolase [unclassified Clostridium]|uniref:alpha/beta hydrolase n=1 Tax=unclassified Clostridium TaxID=2614128 RepID=UPI0025B7F208|nr:MULTISPECIES: alpha/beta hydrolase [unclassified Clostridium]